MPNGPNKPVAPQVYSQVQGPGMKPAYAGIGRDGQPSGFLGYEQDPNAGVIDVPKPPEILALEKKLGTTLYPNHAKADAPHGGQRDYGPPLDYAYDNGKGQIVSFDPSGKQTSIRDKSDSLLPLLGILAMPFVGPALFEALGLGGAAAVGAGEGAAGIGTLTHLTPAALESLAGTAGYGGSAAADAYLSQLAASGITTLPSGPPATPGTPPPPGLELPTPLESPLPVEPPMPSGPPSTPGTPPPPNLEPPGPPPKLTPAAIDSLTNTPGYGKSAAAAAAAASAGLDPNNVGLNADLPFPGVNPTPGIGDLLKKVKDKVLGSSDSGSGGVGLGGALGLMALMSMMNKGGGGTPASTATIPELTATRSQLPYDVDKKGVNPNTPYRPGQGGVTYFSPTTYTPTPPKAAGGGLMSLGGMPNLGSYSDGGRLLQGPGDGVSDSIPAIIGHKQPARLANGEFVIPARIVSELGNGSTDAGAKRLYEMMDRVQSVRRKTKNVAANTKAAKYLPA